MANILVLTASTTDAAYTRTVGVWTGAGHTVTGTTATTTAGLDSAWAGGPFDMIATVRPTVAAADAQAWVRGKWNAGVPVLYGGYESSGSNTPYAYYGQAASAFLNYNALSKPESRTMDVTDGSHPITTGLASPVTLFTADQFRNTLAAALTPGRYGYGTLLGTDGLGQGYLLAIEKGQLAGRSSGSVLKRAGARAVWCGWLNGRQSTAPGYTADAQTMLTRMVTWLTSTPTPVTGPLVEMLSAQFGSAGVPDPIVLPFATTVTADHVVVVETVFQGGGSARATVTVSGLGSTWTAEDDYDSGSTAQPCRTLHSATATTDGDVTVTFGNSGTTSTAYGVVYAYLLQDVDQATLATVRLQSSGSVLTFTGPTVSGPADGIVLGSMLTGAGAGTSGFELPSTVTPAATPEWALATRYEATPNYRAAAAVREPIATADHTLADTTGTAARAYIIGMTVLSPAAPPPPEPDPGGAIDPTIPDERPNTGPFDPSVAEVITGGVVEITGRLRFPGTGAAPVELAILDGRLSWSERRSPRFTASLDCAIPDPDIIALIDPRALVRVDVKIGYRLPDGSLDEQVVATPHLRDRRIIRPAEVLRLDLAGDEALVIDAAAVIGDVDSGVWDRPKTDVPRSVAQLVTGLLSTGPAANPPIVYQVDKVGTGEDVPWPPNDYWDGLEDLLEQIGAELAVDDGRTFVIRRRPTTVEATSAFTLRTGVGGVVLESDSAASRADWANQVVLTHQWTDAAGDTHTVQGVATVTGGPFTPALAGLRTYTERRNTPITEGGATKAAQTLLRRMLSRSRSYVMSAPSAYWLRPGHTVTVDLDAADSTRHLVAEVDHTLADGRMRVTTRLPDTASTIGE